MELSNFSNESGIESTLQLFSYNFFNKQESQLESFFLDEFDDTSQDSMVQKSSLNLNIFELIEDLKS